MERIEWKHLLGSEEDVIINNRKISGVFDRVIVIAVRHKRLAQFHCVDRGTATYDISKTSILLTLFSNQPSVDTTSNQPLSPISLFPTLERFNYPFIN